MSRQRYAWRRMSRGLLLSGVGVFLLLTSLDVLPWSFWGALVPYWPVLLVMLGVRLIFERSRFPAAILLSPLLLLGLMTTVAFTWTVGPVGQAQPLRALRPPEATRWRLEGDLALARLDLRARALPKELLLRGTATGERGRPRISVTGDVAPRVRMRNVRTLTIPPLHGSWWRGGVEADLATELPLSADLDLVLVEGILDLERATVTRADLEGAFLDLTLRLGAPEEDVRITLDGAFNRINLIVPATTPVRVSTEGFMNFTSGRKGRRSGPGYRVRVEGAGNWVAIRSH